MDKVLRENASRASAKDPPLTYREAKERWNEVLEKRAGYGARQPAPARDGGGHSNRGGAGNRGDGARGGGRGRGSASVGLSRGTGARTAAGEPVCFHFNRQVGCSRPKKGSGCDDGRGGQYAHVCNHEPSPGKFCLGPHPRVGNH